MGPERASAYELSLSNREAAEASSMGGGASITSERRALLEGLTTPERLGVAGPQPVPALSLPALSLPVQTLPAEPSPAQGSGSSLPGADSSGQTRGLFAGNTLEPQA